MAREKDRVPSLRLCEDGLTFTVNGAGEDLLGEGWCWMYESKGKVCLEKVEGPEGVVLVRLIKQSHGGVGLRFTNKDARTLMRRGEKLRGRWDRIRGRVEFERGEPNGSEENL